ncbi:hypothetical protein N510_000317 [Firmicutes bacterium ASF500]|nr:hypothetical protein N510_000317 [Firmicutes bacterium ASF500]
MKENAQEPKRLKKPNIFARILALLVTAALVLGALAAVVYRDQLTPGAVRRWLAYQNMVTSETGESIPFTHAGGDKLSIAYLDSGVVTASAAGAHYYGLDGVAFVNRVLNMDNPVLSTSGTTAVAYDAGSQALFAFRGGEEYFSLSLDSSADLLSARANDSGALAVTAQQSGYKGAVTVYNSHGKEIIQISLSSVFAVDAALSPDGRTVAVVTMGQENGSFFSRLLFFPVTQEEPSAQVNLGSINVLDMDYEDGVLWVLCEDRLLTVTPDGETVQTYHISPSYLKGCSLEGDGFALLLTGRYRSGGATQALIIGKDGQVLQSLPLSNQVLDYAAAGKYFGLLSGSRLLLYDLNLKVYATLDNPQGARNLDLSPNGSALLANDQKAWLYIPQ